MIGKIKTGLLPEEIDVAQAEFPKNLSDQDRHAQEAFDERKRRAFEQDLP